MIHREAWYREALTFNSLPFLKRDFERNPWDEETVFKYFQAAGRAGIRFQEAVPSVIQRALRGLKDLLHHPSGYMLEDEVAEFRAVRAAYTWIKSRPYSPVNTKSLDAYYIKMNYGGDATTSGDLRRVISDLQEIVSYWKDLARVWETEG